MAKLHPGDELIFRFDIHISTDIGAIIIAIIKNRLTLANLL